MSKEKLLMNYKINPMSKIDNNNNDNSNNNNYNAKQ